MPHSVLMVDIGPSLQQSFNCLCVSILRGYSQRNRVGRILCEGMKRRGVGSIYEYGQYYTTQISLYTHEYVEVAHTCCLGLQRCNVYVSSCQNS